VQMVTEEDLEAVENALYYVTGLWEDLEQINSEAEPPEYLVEAQVPLPHERESMAHLDVVFYSPADRCLYVVDYKFGVGLVEPKCEQLLGYAAAALDHFPLTREWDIDRIVLGIVQPEDADDPMKLEEVEPLELIEFGHHVNYVVREQVNGNASRGAADPSACTWCDFKSRCGHYGSLMSSLIGSPPWNQLAEPAKIEEIVRHRKEIASFVELCVEEVKTKPEVYPNWARIQVSNGIKWSPTIDEEVIVAKLLGAEANPWTLASPAQIKKRHPDLAEMLDGLVESRGFHIRLKPDNTQKEGK